MISSLLFHGSLQQVPYALNGTRLFTLCNHTHDSYRFLPRFQTSNDLYIRLGNLQSLFFLFQ